MEPDNRVDEACCQLGRETNTLTPAHRSNYIDCRLIDTAPGLNVDVLLINVGTSNSPNSGY